MSNDPSLATALAMSLETAANAALRFDPGTRARLQTLSDKILHIQTHQPTLFFEFSVAGDQLQVCAHSAREANTHLEGPLFSVLSMIFNTNTSLAETGVSVSGQIGLLEQYQSLLNDLDIDWEDALASVIGELPAHPLALAGNRLFGWMKTRAERTPQFFNEFLTEELRAIPAKTELNNYFHAVDQLRQQTERLEAKLNQLLQQKNAKQ